MAFDYPCSLIYYDRGYQASTFLFGEATGKPAAGAMLSPQRMRTALSSSASTATLLQRALPGSSRQPGVNRAQRIIRRQLAGSRDTPGPKPCLRRIHSKNVKHEN